MTQEVSENRKRKYDGTLTATTPKKKRQEPPQKSIFDKKIPSQYVTKKTSLKSIVRDEATSSGIKSVVVMPDFMLTGTVDPITRQLARGSYDAALERVMGEIKANPYRKPPRPAYPNRSKFGLPDKDK